MTYDAITSAYSRISSTIRRTPLLNSPLLDEIAGRQIWAKAECLQQTGSFKFRGAMSAITSLSAEQAKSGVVAFSSGNHAQGVALAARMNDIPAVIIMPSDAPKVKIENTRKYGAEVVLYDRATQDRDEIGAKISQDRGLELIKPFDDFRVIAGQGTVGLEIAEQAAENNATLGATLVCCGGAGLTSGIALAMAETAPSTTVFPVEPEGFDDVARSLASGQHETNDTTSGGLCDAIITPTPGQLTLPILLKHCPRGLVISEEQALMAMRLAFEYLRVVVEPGGAVALAAAIYHNASLPEGPIAAVLSGGNVDIDIFQRALNTELVLP